MTRGVALEVSVRWVGGLARDPGDLQRAGVDPGAVVVAVGQEHRTVGTMLSRSAAVGVPPGKAAIAHPPPRIQRLSGCVSAYPLMVARYSSRVESSDRSHRVRSRPPCTACTCASTKPGASNPPSRSTTSASAGTSSSPTATILPSSIRTMAERPR